MGESWRPDMAGDRVEGTLGERRWMIFTCPYCGALCPDDDWDNAPCNCSDDAPIVAVEVVPAPPPGTAPGTAPEAALEAAAGAMEDSLVQLAIGTDPEDEAGPTIEYARVLARAALRGAAPFLASKAASDLSQFVFRLSEEDGRLVPQEAIIAAHEVRNAVAGCLPQRRAAPGEWLTEREMPCAMCTGSGVDPDDELACWQCDGTGTVVALVAAGRSGMAPSGLERDLLEVLDFVTDALSEALRCNWIYREEVERDAIRENAREAVERGQALCEGRL